MLYDMESVLWHDYVGRWDEVKYGIVFDTNTRICVNR
jgi:hypothetical protein